MGGTVTIVSPEGRASDVDAAAAAAYTARGWHVEGDSEHAENVGGDQRAAQTNVVDALGQGILRGATLGGSDVLQTAIGGDNAQIHLQQLRQAHGTASTIGNVLGAVLPAIATGGASAPESGAAELGTLAGAANDVGELGSVRSLAAASPTGIVSKLGSSIAELGDGGGAVAKAGYSAAGGAAEGALQNAGGYVSDVALGDRKLSADGFIGAMGEGALWGGVAGGALSLSADGLATARRLFPAADMTAAGAQAARSSAASAIGDAVSDSETLGKVAQNKLNEITAETAVNNPGFKQKLEQIKLKAAQDVADAQVAKARGLPTNPATDEALVKGVSGEAALPSASRKLPKDQAESLFGDILGFKPEPAAPANAADDLLSKLQGTKSAMDGGQSFKALSQQQVTDAINEEVAKVNPDAAKILGAAKKAKASSAELSGWLDKYGGDSAVAYDSATAAGKRAKLDAWTKGATPADIEGENAIEHFRGDPENTGTRLGDNKFPADVHTAARDAAAEAAHKAYLETVPEAANLAKSGTELMARSRYAAERAAAKATDEVYTAAGRGIPAATGDAIVGSEQPVAAKIEKALSAKPADFADDISETAPMITRHEAAHADLADAVGDAAPSTSQQRASDFRGAQKAAADKTAAAAAQTADAIAKAPPQSIGAQMLGRAGDAAATYEALRMMGVPLPDPHDIPVVGPLLSAYLKAKVLGKAFGRFGGGVAATAETTIASKSAAIRQRIYSAADAMLSGASKVTGAAQRLGAAQAATVLGHKLFEATPVPQQPYTSQPEKGSLGDLYQKRSAEVNAAMQPGAIQDSLTKRIHTSDPTVLDEIIATKTRQLQYIADKMPRPSSPDGLLEGRIWMPSKTALDNWSRIVAATDKPADVLERAARGAANGDEIEAVKAVYPSLYADAQQHVISQVADGKGRNLTYPQRAAMSRTWGMPLDKSSQPAHAAFLQAGYQPTPPAPSPSAPSGQPTISAPINLGQRTLTHFDQG